MAECKNKTPITSWEAVATRVPRPGFFLGDDGAACPLSNDSVLLGDEALSASWDLGRLCVLPLELLHQITAAVAESDPGALVAFRNINRATAAVVDAMRDFAVVAAFPRAMAALVLLAPGPTAGIPVSLAALAACLRSSDCACCRRACERRRRPKQQAQEAHHHHHPCADDDVALGDCVYLLAPERVCYACFRGCPEYLPVSRPASASASASTTATSSPQPDNDVPAADLPGKLLLLTSIRVPPGRYGVLSSADQLTELYDRRQAAARCGPSTTTTHTQTHMGQPAPIRYAAVILGPYWEDTAAYGRQQASLDRGYGCLACVHTDRKTGYSGWANPLTRYTKTGLQRHVDDPRFGGRVLTWRDAATGIVCYEHDAPRQNRYPPPPEFGAMADLARKYARGNCVPTAVGRKLTVGI